MTRSDTFSKEQNLIRDIFEPLTHVGHADTPPLEMRSDKHFTKRPRKPITFGLQDDAALALLPDNKELVLSKDMLVEGVHFTGYEKPSDIASKALRVNLSDIASKGATPYGYLLGLALGPAQDDTWLRAFATGLKKDQCEYSIPLLGGDLVRTQGHLTISITILGLSEPGGYVARNGAQINDKIYVTGTIGDSYLGLQLALNLSGKNETSHEWISELDKDQAEYLLKRYQKPEPRNIIVSEISKFCTSSMDISDGLIIDAHNLCASSHVGAEIDLTKIPFSEGVRDLVELYPNLLEKLVTGGDDYEILATVPEQLSTHFEQACLLKKIKATHIGMINSDKCRFIGAKGEDIDYSIKGYSHIQTPE